MKEKLKIQLAVSVLLVLVGSSLLVAGFCVPPLGVIDHSVLIAFGEILTFVGAIFGIDYTYKIKILNNREEDKTDDNK
ncbi:MAG: hypothetical protein LBR26_13250 [Prevotella sp.]|jgi:hypothetical protein|nr:hypothetical protein [Prevotella sp.]